MPRHNKRRHLRLAHAHVGTVNDHHMLPGFFVFNFLSLMNNSYAGGKCVALGVGHRRQLQGCGHIDADAVATTASLGVTVEGCTDLIADVVNRTRKHMPVVEYAYTTIPTYPSGQIGFIIASNNASFKLDVPTRDAPSDMKLEYYSTKLHPAAFVLPAFAERGINSQK